MTTSYTITSHSIYVIFLQFQGDLTVQSTINSNAKLIPAYIYIPFLIVFVTLLFFTILYLIKAYTSSNGHKNDLLIKEIQSEFIKYSATSIGLATAIFAGFFIAIRIIFPNLNSAINQADEAGYMWAFILLITIVIGVIACFFVISFIKKISGNFVKNSNQYNDSLTALIQHVNAIKESAFSNIVSWSHSESLEIESKDVWSISYSLNWLYKDDEIRIKNILIELLAYPTHKYFFITLGFDDTRIQENIDGFKRRLKERGLDNDEINFIKKLENVENFNRLIKIEKKFKDSEIRKLNLEGRFRSEKYGGKIPIPNDVSIYKGFQEGSDFSKKIVVINVERNSNKSENDKSFDLKFDSPEQTNHVETWFTEAWKGLTNEDLNNDSNK